MRGYFLIVLLSHVFLFASDLLWFREVDFADLVAFNFVDGNSVKWFAAKAPDLFMIDDNITLHDPVQ